MKSYLEWCRDLVQGRLQYTNLPPNSNDSLSKNDSREGKIEKESKQKKVEQEWMVN